MTKSAVGGSDPDTVTACVVDAEIPRSLVTVNVTWKVPAASNRWLAVTPVAALPSPKFQLYDEICEAPEPGTLACASKIAGMPTVTGVGVTVNAAVGDPAGGRITPGETSLISAARKL